MNNLIESFKDGALLCFWVMISCFCLYMLKVIISSWIDNIRLRKDIKKAQTEMVAELEKLVENLKVNNLDDYEINIKTKDNKFCVDNSRKK